MHQINREKIIHGALLINRSAASNSVSVATSVPSRSTTSGKRWEAGVDIGTTHFRESSINVCQAI